MFDKKNQKKSHRHGFALGYTGQVLGRKPAGLNSRIWKKGYKFGQAARKNELKAWDFCAEEV